MDLIFRCNKNLAKALEAARADVDPKYEILYQNMSVRDAYELQELPFSYKENRCKTILFCQPFEELNLLVKMLKDKKHMIRIVLVCDRQLPYAIQDLCPIVKIPNTQILRTDPIYIGTGKEPLELVNCLVNMKKNDVLKIAKKCHRYKAGFADVCHVLATMKPDKMDKIAHYERLFVLSDKYVSCMACMLNIVFFLV